MSNYMIPDGWIDVNVEKPNKHMAINVMYADGKIYHDMYGSIYTEFIAWQYPKPIEKKTKKYQIKEGHHLLIITETPNDASTPTILVAKRFPNHQKVAESIVELLETLDL